MSMRTFVESLREDYRAKYPRIRLEQLEDLLNRDRITEEEFEWIVGGNQNGNKRNYQEKD